MYYARSHDKSSPARGDPVYVMEEKGNPPQPFFFYRATDTRCIAGTAPPPTSAANVVGGNTFCLDLWFLVDDGGLNF